MKNEILVDQFWMSRFTNSHSLIRELSLGIFGVLFLSLLAQVAIPLPFTPVPITGQSLGVMLIGVSYGARRAFWTTLSYLFCGAIGLPVFAASAFGMAKILGPTGGYLLGFIIAAWCMGFLTEKFKSKTWFQVLPIFILGHLIIFIFGVVGLMQFMDLSTAINLGVTPFLLGTVIKISIASGLLPLFWKFVR